MLSETILKSVDTSKTEEQSAVLDVVGGLTELGAGSVWSIGVEEQSAVLDVVGGLAELGAGSVQAVGVEEQSAVLDVVGGSTTKQVSSKASTQMIVPLGFTSVDKI